MSMKISYASMTDRGPRSVNEDCVETWVAKTGEIVACIADGLGGMGSGEIAARLAVSEFKVFITKHGIDGSNMISAAHAAHNAIIREQTKGNARRMATTFTAISASDNGILGVHCGDSRAAIARGNGIKRLTKDHSEAQILFEAGKLTKDEFLSYPRKHILQSALGNHDDPVIDKIRFDLFSGDRIVLTTDGVHNIIKLRELKRLCSVSSSPSNFIDLLADLIVEHGPIDNYSATVLFVD